MFRLPWATPAGIVIKIPNKKVIMIIFFGSLNLSEKTKNNRHNLLKQLHNSLNSVADISKLTN